MNETVTFKKEDIERIQANFRALSEENDRLKREKEELREQLTPKSVDDFFSLEAELETEEPDTVKNFDDVADVNDLALSNIVHRG